MELISVSKLIPHKQNGYFFDDIEGEPWMAFCESIETSGVIEPVIATQDYTIVSGHQRVRACKALGIEKVLTDIRVFDSEDEVLKQLIETNIRQRGVGNTNAVKLGRCIRELERIYGIKNGNNQHTEKSLAHNEQPLTQEDLAKQLEISKAQMNRYKSLTELIPELQDAVQSGQITATTAMGFVKKLSPEEQKQLAEQIGVQERVPNKKVQEYLDEIQRTKRKVSELETENILLKNRSPEVKEVVKEVVPDDYQTLKNKAKVFDQESARLNQKLKEAYDERNELQDRVNELEHATQEGLESSNLSENVYYFCSMANNFVSNVGGLVWLTERIGDMPEKERTLFLKAARAFRDFGVVFAQNLEKGELENGTGVNPSVPRIEA